jgi:kynurenine formamidase
MQPATGLTAVRLIRTGEVIELGRGLRAGMPMPATRRCALQTKRTVRNPQARPRGSNAEIVTTERGQVGTPLDGFAPQSQGDSLYNCFKISDTATRTGFTKLGIDTVGTLRARGMLLDVAGLQGVDPLPETYEITVQDVQQALQKPNLTLQPGDAVLIHTGWGRRGEQDQARDMKSASGRGVTAVEGLAHQDPRLVSADPGPVDGPPHPDAQLSLSVHQIMLAVHGISLLENLKLDDLTAKGIHAFTFVMPPLKIQGGTGSTVAPVAIR